MNKTVLATTLLLAFSLPLLTACQQSTTAPVADTAATNPGAEPQTMIGQAIDKGMRKAREELENNNLSLNGGIHVRVADKPVWDESENGKLAKAEITPRGDLLIEGKPVAIDAKQRAMLLDYRQQVIGIAEAGMAIGAQGADLAEKAVTQGVASIFNGGDNKDFEARMEAEGKKIESTAKLLCERLPRMLDTQGKLATSLPAFKPYARMTQDDIDDCMDNKAGDEDASRRAEVQAQVQGEIRNEIRKTIRSAVRPTTAAVGDDK